jgi:hypothetical protein
MFEGKKIGKGRAYRFKQFAAGLPLITRDLLANLRHHIGML